MQSHLGLFVKFILYKCCFVSIGLNLSCIIMLQNSLSPVIFISKPRYGRDRWMYQRIKAKKLMRLKTKSKTNKKTVRESNFNSYQARCFRYKFKTIFLHHKRRLRPFGAMNVYLVDAKKKKKQIKIKKWKVFLWHDLYNYKIFLIFKNKNIFSPKEFFLAYNIFPLLALIDKAPVKFQCTSSSLLL